MIIQWKKCYMKCGVLNFEFQNTALHITFLSYHIPFTAKHEPNKLTCFQLCDFVAQLVRALHRHRRGHGFESRWVTWNFQVSETIALIVQQERGSYFHMIIEVKCKLTGNEMARYSYVRWVFRLPLKSLNSNRRKKHEHHNRKIEKISSLSFVLERRLSCMRFDFRFYVCLV